MPVWYTTVVHELFSFPLLSAPGSSWRTSAEHILITYSANCQHTFIYEKIVQKLLSKYQSPKIQEKRETFYSYCDVKIPHTWIKKTPHVPKPQAGLNHSLTYALKWTPTQTTWINLSQERPLSSFACPKGATIHLLLKSLLPADFFCEVTHIKHFIFQSSRWCTEQKHTIASQKMTLELFFSIISFIILLVVMFFVIKPYLALTSTCSGGKPREQRDLEAGIPCNNEGAGRTGALGRQRVPVEHDERLCPGVSIKNPFMIEHFNKDGPNFLPRP